MHVVPDVLPVLHPTIDVNVAARIPPKEFKAALDSRVGRRPINSMRKVEPGVFLLPEQVSCV